MIKVFNHNLFGLFVMGFNVSLPFFSAILRRQSHATSYSAATLERSCRRHLTGAPHPVTTADTGPPSHVSQYSPFNAERKQGSYWYHLFMTFGISRPGIEPAIFCTPSGRSTTKPPGPVKSCLTLSQHFNNFERHLNTLKIEADEIFS